MAPHPLLSLPIPIVNGVVGIFYPIFKNETGDFQMMLAKVKKGKDLKTRKLGKKKSEEK
jgi:hypothetical protein